MSATPINSEETIGTLSDGRAVKAYTLRNKNGSEARFYNLGAAFVGFRLPGMSASESLVLGCDTLDAFIAQNANFGATIGRYANRIGHGKTRINGKALDLECNSGGHHLHGGSQGFGKCVWDGQINLEDGEPTLTFSLTSPAGDAGYPGELSIIQRIRLTDENDVVIDYEASTTETTLVNLTNHAYFNLAGATAGSLRDHQFRVYSDTVTDIDATLLPTGELIPVSETALDLRDWRSIDQALSSLDDSALARAGGYDHNYVFGSAMEGPLTLMAEARHSPSGRWMRCSSTLPGLQFYSGGFLGGTPRNERDTYLRHGAFCMEPGAWPDSPNHDHFPDCTLTPEQTYRATLVFGFGQD
ncbi:aldose epimerase family protein [Saccharospirillum impatiens]|uniref:aldose epimerase family protein n=1 Tax=Saccharospirillum impatiens TaxID=169438 RepID=UPI000426B5D6|nr:aldose epimerase family protein [Saccharospirillum impatiens]